MTKPAEPFHAFRLLRNYNEGDRSRAYKKHDIFIRYGHDRLVNGSSVFCCNELSTLG